MAIVCSQGHSNPDGSAFCDECGERLDGGSATATAPASAASPLLERDDASAGAGDSCFAAAHYPGR